MKKSSVDYTKEQLEIIIFNTIKNGSDANELLSMILNALMLAERTTFLEDYKENKGNGYRPLSKCNLGKNISLQIPRDRLGVFKPLLLEVINQQQNRINDLVFSLYSKGLTTRDIEKILLDFYGDGYSKSSISRITEEYTEIIEAWMNKKLCRRYLAVFIDATFVKVRRGGTVETEAFYVLLGVKEDLTREVLSIVNNPTESASAWNDVLNDLKERGLEEVELVVSDGLSGLGNVISKSLSQSTHQRCVVHFQRSICSKLRKQDRETFLTEFKEVLWDESKDYTPQAALIKFEEMLERWYVDYPKLKKTLKKENLLLLFNFIKYHKDVRRMIYTTNWIERLNKSFKKVLKNRGALPTVKAAEKLFVVTAMDMENGTYRYPVTSFRKDKIFFPEQE